MRGRENERGGGDWSGSAPRRRGRGVSGSVSIGLQKPRSTAIESEIP